METQTSIRISQVIKRDGRIASFDAERIGNAIKKAMISSNRFNEKLFKEILNYVLGLLSSKFSERETPHVEEVQDVVELALVKFGLYEVAKAYILYRKERERIREEVGKILGGRFTKMYKVLSLNALRVLAGRYLLHDLDGNVKETPEEMFDRVAQALAEVERGYGKNEVDVENFHTSFREVMTNLEFLPAGRTLANAGGPTRVVSNCIVLHLEDSMEGIFETLRDASLLQQAGSGLGFPFHLLRPAGSTAVRSRGVASGPVSFLKVYNTAFGVIKQQGRHGANMAVMSVRHPDILEFIHCKAKEGEVRNFNISVGVTDDFMEKVMNDDPTPWMCEWDGTETFPRRIKRDQHGVVTSISEEKLSARELMEEIVSSAWSNGEPGVVFLDIVNKHNPLPSLGRIEACNPCGEQFLHDGDVCNLGSINLEKFVTYGKIDWDRIRFVVRTAVRMLDNVIDLTDFPVEKVNRVFRSNRRIGLGLMGFADMLMKLKVPYNSENGLLMAEKVMSFIQEAARKMSGELAEEKEVFPNWQHSIFAKEGVRLRNAALTSIAPTGSISMICDISSGIEPYFALVYVKSQVMGGQNLYYVNKHLERELKERNLYSEELMKKIAHTGSIQNIEEIPKEIRDLFVAALDISPQDHAKMQAAFQRHTDNSISKTCNFPSNATKEDVLEAYILAWQLGCRGLTVYRSLSRKVEVLHLVKYQKREEQIPLDVSNPVALLDYGESATESEAYFEYEKCPDCKSLTIVYQEGCLKCLDCGWSSCVIN